MKTLVTLLALAATSIAVAEPNDKLPDFGTPADQALNKSREAQLGRGVMLQLRNAGVVVDDPQLTEYLGSLGGQIASHANNGDFNFHFFFVKDNEINAFALPGGYVGVNSGLLLATNNENELAGVLAHEISHVTQRHIARAMYDNEHTSIVSMAAMLAAVLLGAVAHVGGEALTGVVAGTQGLAQQHMINFTRANEAEADRVGMDVLSVRGFRSERHGELLRRDPEALRLAGSARAGDSAEPPGDERAYRRSTRTRTTAAAHEARRQRRLRPREGAARGARGADARGRVRAVQRPGR